MNRGESGDNGMPTLVASDDNKVRALRVMEYRDCHHHTTFDGAVAGNCVDPLGRRKMEDIDLESDQLFEWKVVER